MTNGNTYAVKWIHVYNNVEMRIWWNGYVYLFMSEYGRDESAPTPGGVFRGYFVGECWVFTECFVVISWMFVALLTIRSQRNGRLLAAVGADLSCPCIRARHTFVKRWGTFAIRLKHIHVMFATCSLSVCYIFAVQKYGFCVVKVWFLVCKNHTFSLQKLPF